MAGRDFTLRATPAAVAAIDGLRGRARKSYAAFEAELRKQGCRVAGYRLLGAEDGGYSEFCCKRLAVWNEEMGFVFNDDAEIAKKFDTAAQWREVSRMATKVEQSLCRAATGEPCPI